MSNFTVRVELKGYPSEQEYESLHELMAKQGFTRTIRGITPSGQNATFDLPHATYYGYASTTTGDLRDYLKAKIRAAIQPNIAIFVAKTETWAIG